MQFKAEFCAYVDRLLKVSNPQEHFLYYDLIQPSKCRVERSSIHILYFQCHLYAASKKTIYLLKMLQNYYHFYNMVRIQVEEEGNDVVNCYEVAVAERNKCVRENQVAKDKVDRVLK